MGAGEVMMGELVALLLPRCSPRGVDAVAKGLGPGRGIGDGTGAGVCGRTPMNAFATSAGDRGGAFCTEHMDRHSTKQENTVLYMCVYTQRANGQAQHKAGVR